MPAASTPPDQAARDRALDTTQSWIVQAPAGAGKTELLTSRFLALLARVDEPEEILAITFTRAATAEMRERVLYWLRAAADEPGNEQAVAASGERPALTLARAALAHARRRGWQLLDQPQRLDIQTIDALAMRLAHAQPLLARLGGKLDPSEDAQPMYAQAARRTLARLGDPGHPDLSAALRRLLLLRDNNLRDTETLVADMLAHRDQWAHVFPLAATSEVDWAALRAALEMPFARAIERTLARAHAALAAMPSAAERLIALGRYACANDNKIGIDRLGELEQLPTPTADALPHWLCLASLLLTKDGGWRARYTASEGFPVAASGPRRLVEAERRDAMLALQAELQGSSTLLDALCDLRRLPAPRYDETQWDTLQSVFRILRHATAELRVVFAERNQVDFTELGLAAQLVLAAGEPGPAQEQAARTADLKRHLLVDEFQDTSRRQHTFLSLLLREWQPGDGRTAFLVGDPMQSIYLFRQAEFELFHHVQQHGIPCGPYTHPCGPLHLKANFRSHSGLVDPLNGYFSRIFSAGEAADTVPFSASAAIERGKPAVHIQPSFNTRDPESKAQAYDEEAAGVLRVIRRHLPLAERARLNGEPHYTIAVLVRARPHLTRIIARLREAHIPYRAIDLEPLTGRQEILDLLSLTRALLMPTDRLSWLSVLHAPWCGLTLADLHQLTGADDRGFRSQAIPELIASRAALLSEDGQRRLARTHEILAGAIADRFNGRGSFAAWVEQTWQALGGAACVDAAALENTRVFFRLLDRLSPDGMAVLSGEFAAALARLCAEPSVAASATHGVQLLTIHKSKGLGFDVVIVPGLERGTGHTRSPLVTMLERARPDQPLENEVLMAPLGGRGLDRDRTYKWIERQRQRREDEERKRLVYVACTRARRELHLFATATVTYSGALQPGDTKSLLDAAWPALESHFTEAHRQRLRPAPAPDQATIQFPQPGVVDLAAGAESHSALGRTPVLRRLPAAYAPAPALANVVARAARRDAPGFTRPEAGRAARAQGNAVHALFEVLAETLPREPSIAEAELAGRLRRRAEQVLREAAFSGAELARLVSEAVALARNTAAHTEGRWILAAHPEAQSETEWTQWVKGAARRMRADRTFLAGDRPLSTGTSHLWVVDYKSGPVYGDDTEAYLADQQQIYCPQLEAYGAAARAARVGATVGLRYALYFPRLQRLVWWAPAEPADRDERL